MLIRIIPVFAVAFLFLAGCDKSADETTKSVAKAREEAGQEVTKAQQAATEIENNANEKLAEAQQDYAESDTSARAKLSKAESEAMISKAQADLDVAMAAAEGSHRIAVEKCGLLTGVDKNACLSTADAAFTADKASIIAQRDMTLVQAEHHD